jgi:ferredoxin-NADP reductase
VGRLPYLSKLVSRAEVAELTTAFRSEKPSNWTFKAGQFLDMTLLKPAETDAEGNTRTFSIASAPHEETLMVATRMRNTAFKRVLNAMPHGSAVKIEGPSGSLSIVFRAAKEKLPHRIFLFYSNRPPEDARFLDELEALETENPNYKLVASMKEMARSHQSWDGETGPDRQRIAFAVSEGCPYAHLLYGGAARDGEGPPHDSQEDGSQ